MVPSRHLLLISSESLIIKSVLVEEMLRPVRLYPLHFLPALRDSFATLQKLSSSSDNSKFLTPLLNGEKEGSTVDSRKQVEDINTESDGLDISSNIHAFV